MADDSALSSKLFGVFSAALSSQYKAAENFLKWQWNAEVNSVNYKLSQA